MGEHLGDGSGFVFPRSARNMAFARFTQLASNATCTHGPLRGPAKGEKMV